ncbi:molybdopterin guanine dinucleotide-containing S/N-oxide reductase [bacterium]|nr:MAG: molybdopterin guanine dinucleotide-containing S/N-oxide reductase [bacterium]
MSERLAPGEARISHSSHWGAFQAVVSGGRVVRVEPAPFDPDPSALLESIPDALYSHARVAAPSVRKGWLENGPGSDGHRRGSDSFVQVPWPEAISLVAGELSRVRSDHGSAAIFGGSYGWSSAGRFHHAKTQLERFLNCFGGCTGQIHNYSYAAALALLPHVLGSAASVSGTVTTWDSIAASSGLVVMFGGLPLKNLQVEAGGVGAHTTPDWLRRARAAGVQFINVSPIRDDAPDFIDAEWLPVRPTSDTAMMLGLAHVLVTEGLHDTEFLERYCVGFDRFRAYLMGARDGRAKTPEWAAAICGLDAERIRRLARQMAGTRTMLSVTWSLQRADHGEQPYWMAITLAAMLGQIGLPGAGFGFGYGDVSAIGSRRLPFPSPSLETGVNPMGRGIPVARVADMLLNPGAEYDFDGERKRYPDIKLVYWAGGNPFHHHQDLNRLLQAWSRPETIIVHEPWWTATARHADIVLPASTTLERNDLGASGRDRYLIAMKRAVDPLGDARSDFDIFSALAVRLGIETAFTEGRDEMAWIKHIYEKTRERAAESDIALPAFERFWADGHVRVEIPETPYVLYADFRADPDRSPLPTPSGRIEIYSATIDGFGYEDCIGHPAWFEPSEWLGSPLAAEYPLHLISNQPKTRLHGQLDSGRVSMRSKIRGHEPCRMHPSDAARREIATGDIVRLYNARGSCLAGAILTDAVRPGVVQLSTGAWFDPDRSGALPGVEKHGNPNVLTPDHGTSKVGQGPSAHSALVQVERYAGADLEVTAFAVPEVSARKSVNATQFPGGGDR